VLSYFDSFFQGRNLFQNNSTSTTFNLRFSLYEGTTSVTIVRTVHRLRWTLQHNSASLPGTEVANCTLRDWGSNSNLFMTGTNIYQEIGFSANSLMRMTLWLSCSILDAAFQRYADSCHDY